MGAESISLGRRLAMKLPRSSPCTSLLCRASLLIVDDTTHEGSCQPSKSECFFIGDTMAQRV